MSSLTQPAGKTPAEPLLSPATPSPHRILSQFLQVELPSPLQVPLSIRIPAGAPPSTEVCWGHCST